MSAWYVLSCRYAIARTLAQLTALVQVDIESCDDDTVSCQFNKSLGEHIGDARESTCQFVHTEPVRAVLVLGC